jgi:pimeloyl-ACP methyl ester carboxylesterase
MTPRDSGTIPINGFDMYYEARGEGEPLVLLHGGGGIGANWNLIFEQPPSGFRTIVPDLRWMYWSSSIASRSSDARASASAWAPRRFSTSPRFSRIA